MCLAKVGSRGSNGRPTAQQADGHIALSNVQSSGFCPVSKFYLFHSAAEIDMQNDSEIAFEIIVVRADVIYRFIFLALLYGWSYL